MASRRDRMSFAAIGGKPKPPAGPTGDQLAGYNPNSGISADFLTRQPDNLNPLLPTYFQFSMKRCPHVTFFCQSANLPSISASPLEQPTRFVGIPHAPGIPEFDDLTINFIVDEEMNKKFRKHRDGSTSCYLSDPDGNKIEFLLLCLIFANSFNILCA